MIRIVPATVLLFIGFGTFLGCGSDDQLIELNEKKTESLPWNFDDDIKACKRQLLALPKEPENRYRLRNAFAPPLECDRLGNPIHVW